MRSRSWSGQDLQEWLERLAKMPLVRGANQGCEAELTSRRDAILNGNRITTQIFNFGSISAPGNTFNNRCCRRDVKPGTGEIIQKEQGFRALYQDIVDAHGNQVYADGVMPVQFDGEFYFRSNAVGA